MVFPGRFSTGCLRCRQRKVKCDEAKPTCRRCYTYGKPCLGYTDQFHFRHSERKKTGGSPSNTASPSISESKQINTSLEQDKCPAYPEAVTMIRSPKPSRDNLSLCYFLRRFVSPNDSDGFPGHFTFLPELYDHYNHGLLEKATLSVSQLAAFNQFGGEELRTQSLRNHVSVIRDLQKIFQHNDQLIDDKVIATILLLCTYKDISGEGLEGPNEHAPGLFYLLERRGPEQILTKRGAELFFLALLRLQIYSFLQEDDAYTDPGAIASVMSIFDPLLRAMSMMSKTLSLRHRLSQYLQIQIQQQQVPSTFSSSHNYKELQNAQLAIQEGFKMLDDFDIWDQEAASYWQTTFEGRGVPTGLGQMGNSNTNYDAETACIIILIRSARLILLLTMLLYHSMLQQVKNAEEYSFSSLWAECVPVLESDVRKAIEDMLAGVPYALGDIDLGGMPATMAHDGAAGIIIVHSIRLVSHCVYATPAQLERADIILKRMNSAIGIRSAVGWAEGQSRPLCFGREQGLLCPLEAVPGSTHYNIAGSVSKSFEHANGIEMLLF